jgi:hypothetical protein
MKEKGSRLLGGCAERRPTDEIFARTYWEGETPSSRGASGTELCQMRLEDGNDSNLPDVLILIMKLIVGLFGLAFLAACETTTITPTATMKPALADRLAVLNTDEPMPPAEGPEDVAPGPARDPTRNPGLVPSPLLRYSAASMTP